VTRKAGFVFEVKTSPHGGLIPYGWRKIKRTVGNWQSPFRLVFNLQKICGLVSLQLKASQSS